MISSLLALLYCLLLSAGPALAHTTTATQGPTMQLDIGFEQSYRMSAWTPAIVTLRNNGPLFQGKLTVNIYTGPPNSTYIAQVAPWSFQQPVTLAQGAQQHLTLYIPFAFSNYIPRGFVANLLDAHGQVVASQVTTRGYNVKPNDLLIGLLTSPQANLNALNTVSLPNQSSSLTTSQLDPSSFPTTSSALDVFDVMLLDNFASRTLKQNQLAALQTWVNQGGLLIEVGGTSWQATLGSLPPTLLPAIPTGTTTLAPGTPLFPTDGTSSPAPVTGLNIPLTISTATISNQGLFSDIQELVSTDESPLLIEAHQGKGTICYLAFDPTTAPLTTWSGTPALWSTILMHTLGEKFLIPSSTQGYDSGPGQLLAHGGILTMIEPQTLPGPWILALVLFCYLAMIGPLRILIIRRWNLPKWWGWRIFLGSVVFFSLFAYGLASSLQGAAFTDNSIELIQLNQDGTSAHITSYIGLFAPTPGSIQVHIPGANLTQPLNSQLLTNSYLPFVQDDPPATIEASASGTTLTLQNLSQWTYHPVVIQQDRSLPGHLNAHLALSNNTISGTITNTLGTALSDVYVLFEHGMIPIGHLQAGATYHMNAHLSTALSPGATSLAGEIHQHVGLPASYFPYGYSKQPQDNLQRHMALLSALNGSGFTFPPCNGPCTTNAIINREAIFPTGTNISGIQTNSPEHDPLLIPGAPLTLIGWTDQQLSNSNDVTLNGIQPNGFHESFLQMPLALDTLNASSIPANFIAGHVIAIQGYDAQLLLPGVYTLATGSLTFELDAPSSTSNALSITMQDLLTQRTGQANGILPASPLQAHLYNWLTHTWDTITFERNTYTTTDIDAYSGPTGRILLQVNSKNKAQIYFAAPSLRLFTVS